jgi:hypothetical protein
MMDSGSPSAPASLPSSRKESKMKRFLFASFAALGVVVTGVFQEALAQVYPYYQSPYNRYPQPALSPYLNLLRGGSPSANYFLGVLPERDRRAMDLQFRNSISDIDRRLATPAPEAIELGERPRLPPTGHATYFSNYSSYYNLYPLQRTGQAPAALAAPIAPAPTRRARSPATGG